MIRPTVFNKVVSALTDLRLKLVIEGKTQQDREDINSLFDLAIAELYKELRSQRRRPTQKSD